MDELIPIAAFVMITILGSIPLIGLTIRFAIKPAVESIAQAVSQSQGRRSDADLGVRMDHMEVQLEQIQAALEHLADTRAFDRELSPRSTDPSALIPTPSETEAS